VSAVGSRTRPPKSTLDAGTRRRILEAAAQCFADRGFEATTVREVCRKARANGAAVHYHFGSKDGLYLEAIRWATTLCHAANTTQVVDAGKDPSLTPRQRFVTVVRLFAKGMLHEQPEWHLRLMWREMTRPTIAMDAIVKEFIRPRFAAMCEAVRGLRPAADERTVSLLAMSVVGQILYHRFAAPVALKLLGERAYDAALVDAIVEHVVAFSLRALESGPGSAA
jgi:AcrR family transcriptional regulator